LLVKLKALQRVAYNPAYHKDLQGLVYRFLRNSKFKALHDKKGYKYFSFSNIIPPSRVIDEGSEKNLIIASPDRDFIETVSNRLEMVPCGEVRVGEMIFKVEETRIFSQELPENEFDRFTLSSGTPIVVRIPKNRLKEYEINQKRPYRYIYWRKEYTPEAFIKQLEENLIKKYNEYYDTELEPFQVFEELQFRKQVAIPLKIKESESTVIGTLWNFYFTPVNGLKKRLLQFGLDVGFGEMNSLGFGFMNVNLHYLSR